MGYVFLQSPVGCTSMQEGMRFTSPTLMESEVRTALVLLTLPYTLSLKEIGPCLPWAVTTSLQFHAREGKNPITLWKTTFTPAAIQDINNA